MNFNKFLLASSFMALMILPACNWWGTPETVVIEEIVVVEPETESLQDQQTDDLLLEAEELNDLSLLNEK